mmetsp:Transcript_20909/g.48894  ORF Transcript_20909/g.48894 Transcript_20909/m.48894 type:complete len:210 (+) Transcript_20909:3884-4513(+)
MPILPMLEASAWPKLLATTVTLLAPVVGALCPLVASGASTEKMVPEVVTLAPMESATAREPTLKPERPTRQDSETQMVDGVLDLPMRVVPEECPPNAAPRTVTLAAPVATRLEATWLDTNIALAVKALVKEDLSDDTVTAIVEEERATRVPRHCMAESEIHLVTSRALAPMRTRVEPLDGPKFLPNTVTLAAPVRATLVGSVAVAALRL